MAIPARLRLALCLCFLPWASCAKQPFAEKMFGVWMPKKGVTPISILGPLAYEFLGGGIGGFSALRDGSTGDVWFTLLTGQMWHLVGNQAQYCFGDGMLGEQSPFDVRSVFDTNVTLCWRAGLRGMPTHTVGCSGCDCAKITLSLSDEDTLHFKFWMSPPVVHADLHFVRTGSAPGMASIWKTMLNPYEQCAIRDHYGPNVPGEPDLRNKTSHIKLPGGCASASLNHVMKSDDLRVSFQHDYEEAEADTAALGTCRQLNGMNLKIDRLLSWTDKYYHVPDVQVQYRTPHGRCNPCDVTWEVSAKIEEDEYIGFGFKGQSWEHMFPYPPETSRPCYFGMCIDAYDNFTSDRIAVGYSTPSNGAYLREMVAKELVGSLKDTDYKIFKNTKVARVQGRTWMTFTVSQHWPHGMLPRLDDGPFRTMWAIGKVSGGKDEAANVGYHAGLRGVAPMSWLVALGSSPCRYKPFPAEQGDIVHI